MILTGYAGAVTQADDILKPRVDREAYAHDPLYHTEVQDLRDALNMVERSLVQTGTPARHLTGILTTLVKGVPDAAEAHQRIAEFRRRVHEVRTAPPRPIRVPVGLVGCQRCGNPYTEPGLDGRCNACADIPDSDTDL